MRKITDFIVNKRHFILVICIILAIISAIISLKVNVNYDITKYLPDTSETRIGMDIMEKEFSGKETSYLNLMFKGLKQEEKNDVLTFLNNLNGVEEVDYDESENYNKDDYTLFSITVDDNSDSKIASDIYKEVTSKYKDYEIYTSGDISDRNNPVLPKWIVALAVICALIILIVMCESYTEPFLFLFSILIAVLFNKGTNIIFPSISYITDSIAAILQLALSMDYSIILMNRYNQEKENEPDKIKAMKNALYNSFKSISSSSLTTIVGLIVLVFMSFTIGRDLGLILAKGVLFSLISIFFVLPGLILMFDKLIVKTKKKSPNIKLDFLGKFSYKIRYFAIPIFLVIFVVCFLLKGNLQILYTNTSDNKISDIFEANNQIAIIYKNEDEEKVANIINNIKDEEKINEILAYSNTINESLQYDKLKDKLNDLGSSIDIEDYFIKVLYYDYYSKNNQPKISFEEFVEFIKKDVYNNENMSKQINDEKRKSIDRLENFVHYDSINRKRRASEISEILDIDKSKLNDIFVLYSAKNDNIKIGINTFIDFINNEVLNNSKYSSNIDEASRNKLNKLSKYIDISTIQNKLTYNEMAKLFEIDESKMKDLYTYYISLNNIETKLTLSEFSEFVLDNVAFDENYASSLNVETIEKLKILSTFSNKNIIKTNANIESLANIFGIDKETVSKILFLKYSKINSESTEKVDISNWESTPYEFTNLILDNINNENIKANIDENSVEKLKLLSNIMKSSLNEEKYLYKDMAKFIGVNENSVKNIYAIYVLKNEVIKMNSNEFVNFVLEHKNDEMLKGKFENGLESDLQLLKKVFDGILNNKKYTKTEISDLLAIDKEKTKLLYGLYNENHINTDRTISLKELIEFLLDDVITNKDYSENFDSKQIEKLKIVSGIMSTQEEGRKYTSGEIFGILSILSDNVEKNVIELLFTYYGSENEYNNDWKLTIEEFVRYLNENILQDERFQEFLDNEKKDKITEAKDKIKDAKELLVAENYSRAVINTKFDFEDEETFAFIQKVKDLIKENEVEAFVIGDSPMAYEMSKTFTGELDFITVLTMISIFVVVAITFKSILAPIILVFVIQCAVYITMVILHVTGDSVYFIALLIVQSILMGATIDYAILYTSYYMEHRKNMEIKEAIINSYNKSIHTILNSSSILIIVTLIVARFSSAIASKICKTISEGTLCSTILILILLPAMLAACDKFIIKKENF